ncbi:MAG: helix-turn-helix domain-containing protein [Acidimicrobiales bacterium]
MSETVWMGTPEAAEYLGVVLRTLYRLIDKDEIPAFKVGRVIRVKQADLDAFLETNRVKPGDLKHLYPDAVETDAD